MRKPLCLLALLPGLAHGAITYVGAGTASNAIDGGAVTPSVHASTTTGDLVLCLVGQKNGTNYTILTSTGYTQLYGRNGGSGRSAVVLLGKIATGSDSVSVDSSDNTAGRTVIGQCVTFRGTLNTVTGIVSVSAGTDNTTQAVLNTPALTVTDANTLVVVGGIREHMWNTDNPGPLSTMTEIGQPDRTSSAQAALKWDYVIQTTAANISADTTTWASTLNTAEAASIIVSLKPAVSAPTWSVSPTVSAQDDNDYTLSYTPSTSATFYAVACAKDETAPTIAQVKAAHCTGDAAAIASVNEAVTGADTTVLGGSLTRPVHDLYAVLSNAGGDSMLVTLADEMLDAPTGYQYTTLTSVGTEDANPCKKLNETISPTIAAGDILKTTTTVPPGGEALTVDVDCNMDYADPLGNRRSTTLAVYDTSAQDWMSGGPTTIYFNNSAPQCVDPECVYDPGATIRNGVAADAVAYLPMFWDVESDAITLTTSITGTGTGAGKIPAGTSYADGTWTISAPSCAGADTSGSFTVTGTDIAGDSVDITTAWVCYSVAEVPSCVGLTPAACDAALAVGGFSSVHYSQCDGAEGIVAGTVLATYPAAAASADYGSEVRVVSWRGNCPVAVGSLPSRRYVRNRAIAPVSLSPYYTLGDAAFESCSLRTLGASFASTTASGAGTNTQFITLADASDVSPGDWLRIGTSTYRQAMTVNWTTGLVKLNAVASWSNGVAVDAMTAIGATIAGLSFEAGSCTLSGTPTSSGVTQKMLVRVTDQNGNYADIP